jgi:hypothetical protein
MMYAGATVPLNAEANPMESPRKSGTVTLKLTPPDAMSPNSPFLSIRL